MSWDELDLDGEALQKTKAETEAKSREISTQFHQCFRTDAGQFVLAKLKEATVDKPVLDANSSQFGAGIREGQNNLFRQIMAEITKAEQE